LKKRGMREEVWGELVQSTLYACTNCNNKIPLCY
jgi:hypothetical protein